MLFFRLMFCCAAAYAAAAAPGGDAQPAIEGTYMQDGIVILPSALARKKLDCDDPQSIRDLKDHIAAKLGSGRKAEEAWTRTLCGEEADDAGRNPGRKNAAPRVPGFPRFDTGDQNGSRARAKKWYMVYLGVSSRQADDLVQYGSHGVVWPVRASAPRMGTAPLMGTAPTFAPSQGQGSVPSQAPAGGGPVRATDPIPGSAPLTGAPPTQPEAQGGDSGAGSRIEPGRFQPLGGKGQ